MIGQVSLWMVAVLAVASVMALTAPASADPPRRVGAALVLGGAAIVVAAVADRRWSVVAAGVVSVAFGALLRDDPGRFGTAVVYSTAGISVLAGLAVAVWLRRRGFGWLVVIAAATLGAAIGWLFTEYETELLPLGFGLIGLAAVTVVGSGFAMAAERVRASDRQIVLSDAIDAVGRWIGTRLSDELVAEDESGDVDRLFFEGADRNRRLVRFYALMGFAAVIASLGILVDSTAVVIGAMLIAPLMTPLMAMSLSLVSLWTDRLGRASVTAATGALIPVGVGVIVTAVLGQGVDPATNTQIVSRASPTLLDLAIAFGAGAAGAYANSRRDVADSLPGVAVAIALVPPLAVVGAAAQLGDWEASRGALLLFLTNALAIVAVGSVTFVLTGVARAPGGVRGAVGHWVVVFGAFGFAVLWSLMASTSSANATGAQRSISRRAIETWASAHTYEVESVELDGAGLDIVLIGETAPDDEAVEELLTELDHVLDDIEVALRVDLTATIETELD